MSDQRLVVEALAAAAAAGEPVALASVVRVAGSAYRGAGTRMLVRADGTTVGLVSGGCLEADLVAHAGRARAAGRPTVVTYDARDARADEDLTWGLGLGCNGLLEVLVEPLAPARAAAVAALLGRALQGDAPAVLATVVRAPDDGGALHGPAVGARVLVDAAGDASVDGSWGPLLDAVVADAAQAGWAPGGAARLARRGVVREYGPDAVGGAAQDAGADAVQVAFELAEPPVRLVVCGSGPDAAPVARLAAGLGWDVTVVDHRPAALVPAERFPGARVAGCADARALAGAVTLTARTAAVVMSHHFERDCDYLEALLAAGVAYAGVLGPRARTERMLAALAAPAAGDPPGRARAAAPDPVYGPVGLDRGGDGPEAIALAIVAEVLAVTGGRAGGHLRERRAPIHDAPARAAAAFAP